MKVKSKKNLITILRLIATIAVIPLVFSTFFSGYNVVSEGSQINTPVGISIFEFPAQKDLFLALGFVCSVLEVVLIVFNIFYGVTRITKKNPDNLIGIITIIFELILTPIPIIMIGLFCNKNSVLGLTYSIGLCPILYFVCGIVFGGLMLASYLIKVKKQNQAIKQ